MSLYDGINVDMGAKNEEGQTWSSAGMKLLQTQMQLKKAALTQVKRDKTKSATPSSSTISPVVDLSGRGGEGKRMMDSRQPNLLKRKQFALDGPPLSFMSMGLKDEKVLIFGEIVVEEEYNPLMPNDYNKVLVKQEAERKQQRELDRRQDIEDSERRKRERAEREEREEEEGERRKRVAGAAIAPPTCLLEGDKKVDNPFHPSVVPDFDNAGKGLGVAAKIMEKYGHKHGLGLGRQGQGMTTALQVERTGARMGRIIHERDTSKDESMEMPPPPAPGAMLPPPAPAPRETPITEVLKNPTKVVVLRNMVSPGEVDADLEGEVKEEMFKYGEITKCLIYEMPPPAAEDEAVRVFLEFAKVDFAIKVVDLNGRFFGGRSVRASFYDPDKFHRFDLTAD